MKRGFCVFDVVLKIEVECSIVFVLCSAVFSNIELVLLMMKFVRDIVY